MSYKNKPSKWFKGKNIMRMSICISEPKNGDAAGPQEIREAWIWMRRDPFLCPLCSPLHIQFVSLLPSAEPHDRKHNEPLWASATRQKPRWLSLLQSKYAKEEMHQPSLGCIPSSRKRGCESESCYLKRCVDNCGECVCVCCM